jgi:hypothetical protein
LPSQPAKKSKKVDVLHRLRVVQKRGGRCDIDQIDVLAREELIYIGWVRNREALSVSVPRRFYARHGNPLTAATVALDFSA